MRSITLSAYAKVNLFLDVLAKRSDGYHTLVTLFERIDLSDAVTLEKVSGEPLEIRCNDPAVATDGTNLVARAVESFRGITRWRQGLKITLEKGIPVAGGLGGGSSDAATTLLALQELSGIALSKEEAKALAQNLGADVSFFLEGTPWALGKERGDAIEPVPLKAQLWHLLVWPGFPIPTKAVYDAFRLTPFHPDVTLLLRALRETDVSGIRDLLFNALEPTVENLYPALCLVKAAMEKPGELMRPCVSGSGSTVFALCESEAEAQSAAERIRRCQPAWTVTVAKTV